MTLRNFVVNNSRGGTRINRWFSLSFS